MIHNCTELYRRSFGGKDQTSTILSTTRTHHQSDRFTLISFTLVVHLCAGAVNAYAEPNPLLLLFSPSHCGNIPLVVMSTSHLCTCTWLVFSQAKSICTSHRAACTQALTNKTRDELFPFTFLWSEEGEEEEENGIHCFSLVISGTAAAALTSTPK